MSIGRAANYGLIIPKASYITSLVRQGTISGEGIYIPSIGLQDVSTDAFTMEKNHEYHAIGYFECRPGTNQLAGVIGSIIKIEFNF